MDVGSSTIDLAEAAHFDAQATDWWNPRGSSAMLHQLNPVRLGYIRAQLDSIWRLDRHIRKPLTGRRALDVGCGAGLMTEPLARLGADVTGLDAAAKAIAVARAHAEAGGLAIDYRSGGIEDIAFDAEGRGRFDLVTAMEVIEHVADRPAFVAGLARALAPGGVLILSTPNRTPLSKLMIVTLAETFGQISRGTHDWDSFIAPDELAELLADAGLRVSDQTGLAWMPGRGFTLGDDLRLNYLVMARAVET